LPKTIKVKVKKEPIKPIPEPKEEKKSPSEKSIINKLYSTDLKTKTLGF